MNETQPPLPDIEQRAWLVRFQRSPAGQDWLVEVKPVGSDASYRFPNQAAWLAWCAEVLEPDQGQERSPE